MSSPGDLHDSVQGKIVHVYDGILEADRSLPRWWLGILFGTMAFGAVYYVVYQALKIEPTPAVAYREEAAAKASAEAARMRSMGTVSAESLLAMAKDPATVAQGKEVFVSTCSACHRADGGGAIGPNLTDKFWLHGGGPAQIYATVRDGVTTKGMPAWGPQLGEERVRAAAAYVLTLKGTNVAGGKAAQGTEEP